MRLCVGYGVSSTQKYKLAFTAQNINNKKKDSGYFLYMTNFLIVLDLNVHLPIDYGLKMKQILKCLFPYLESSDQKQYSCSALLNLQTTSFQT